MNLSNTEKMLFDKVKQTHLIGTIQSVALYQRAWLGISWQTKEEIESLEYWYEIFREVCIYLFVENKYRGTDFDKFIEERISYYQKDKY